MYVHNLVPQATEELLTNEINLTEVLCKNKTGEEDKKNIDF